MASVGGKRPFDPNIMTYEKNKIIINVKRKYEIDIIGETKLKVKIDDVIIDQKINTEYVKEIK